MKLVTETKIVKEIALNPYSDCEDASLYLYRYDPRRYRFAEYEVDLIRKNGKRNFMAAFEKGNRSHYWTRVPVDEGKPGMHCVWFTERNAEEAIRILRDFEKTAIQDKDVKIIGMCIAYQAQKNPEWKGNNDGRN